MSGGKKHPLEIFKSSGRSLGGQVPRDAGNSGDSGDSGESSEPVSRAAPGPDRTEGAASPRALSEFELRLTLPGALVLLFSWVILMGAAYMYGHSRGRDGFLEERDKAALALGRQIESGPSSPSEVGGRAGSAPVSQPRPWGVLLVTYQSYQEERINEISRVLREHYRIRARIQPWSHSDGKVEVFVGVFERSDDPELKKLVANLRRIRDWPSGNDRTPFEDSYVKRHPGVPSDPASAAGN